MHTWYLGVEEQFYFLFPWLFGIAHIGNNLKTKVLVFGTLALVSMCLRLYHGARGEEIYAFFLLHSRAWEVFFGVITCHYLVEKSPSGKPLFGNDKSRTLKKVQIFSFVCVVAAHFVQINDSHAMTVLATLMAVSGTAAFFAAGHGQNWSSRNSEKKQENLPFLNYCFSLEVPQKVGQISYALYLWHWPAAVLMAECRPFLNNNYKKYFGGGDVAAFFLYLALTVFPSVFSYFFVENPFRLWRPCAHTWGKFGAMLLPGCILIFLIILLEVGLSTLIKDIEVRLLVADWTAELKPLLSVNDCFFLLMTIWAVPLVVRNFCKKSNFESGGHGGKKGPTMISQKDGARKFRANYYVFSRGNYLANVVGVTVAIIILRGAVVFFFINSSGSVVERGSLFGSMPRTTLRQKNNNNNAQRVATEEGFSINSQINAFEQMLAVAAVSEKRAVVIEEDSMRRRSSAQEHSDSELRRSVLKTSSISTISSSGASIKKPVSLLTGSNSWAAPSTGYVWTKSHYNWRDVRAGFAVNNCACRLNSAENAEDDLLHTPAHALRTQNTNLPKCFDEAFWEKEPTLSVLHQFHWAEEEAGRDFCHMGSSKTRKDPSWKEVWGSCLWTFNSEVDGDSWAFEKPLHFDQKILPVANPKSELYRGNNTVTGGGYYHLYENPDPADPGGDRKSTSSIQNTAPAGYYNSEQSSGSQKNTAISNNSPKPSSPWARLTNKYFNKAINSQYLGNKNTRRRRRRTRRKLQEKKVPLDDNFSEKRRPRFFLLGDSNAARARYSSTRG